MARGADALSTHVGVLLERPLETRHRTPVCPRRMTGLWPNPEVHRQSVVDRSRTVSNFRSRPFAAGQQQNAPASPSGAHGSFACARLRGESDSTEGAADNCMHARQLTKRRSSTSQPHFCFVASCFRADPDIGHVKQCVRAQSAFGKGFLPGSLTQKQIDLLEEPSRSRLVLKK